MPPFDAGGVASPETIDTSTRQVVAKVQADGTCWLGGTVWHGMATTRISVSNRSTTEEDAGRSVSAILECGGVG